MLNVRKLLDDWRHATIVARWLRCFWRWRKISHAVRIRKSQIIARIHKKATQRCYPTQKMPPGECYSPNPTTLSEPHTRPLLIIVQCSIYLQIEHLSGRNEELRHELHNAREESAKSIMQLERKNAKVHGSFCNLWNKPVIIISNIRNRFPPHYAESEKQVKKGGARFFLKKDLSMLNFLHHRISSTDLKVRVTIISPYFGLGVNGMVLNGHFLKDKLFLFFLCLLKDWRSRKGSEGLERNR